MLKERITELIRSGMIDQRKIFDVLYPTFTGHYSQLREEIARVKNEGLG